MAQGNAEIGTGQSPFPEETDFPVLFGEHPDAKQVDAPSCLHPQAALRGKTCDARALGTQVVGAESPAALCRAR